MKTTARHVLGIGLVSLLVCLAGTTVRAENHEGACDRADVKLSFSVSFQKGWESSITSSSDTGAQFQFSNNAVKIHILKSPGKEKAIRLSLHDMLQAPLLEGERYRLCFTIRATEEFRLAARFLRSLPARKNEILHHPEKCVFFIPKGMTHQSCEFVSKVTTEADQFTLFLGNAPSGSEIEISDMIFHLLTAPKD